MHPKRSFRMWTAATVLVAALVAVAEVDLSAQREPATGGRGGATPASASTSQDATASALVEVREVFLSISDVNREQDAAEANRSKTGQQFLRSGRLDAAQSVLRQMSRTQVVATRRTVVTVVGGTGDRDRVVNSLADVTRRVLVLWANTDAKSGSYDNSVLKGSLLDRPKTLQNVWVYLPSSAQAPDSQPTHMLPARLATKVTWMTFFTADGDMPNTDSLNRAPSGSTAPAAQNAGVNRAQEGFALDTVVVTRIAGVKVLAQPNDSARVLATLPRGEELVVTGTPNGDFVKVQSASVEGWVKQLLIVEETATSSAGRGGR